jgi:transmembrane sensor
MIRREQDGFATALDHSQFADQAWQYSLDRGLSRRRWMAGAAAVAGIAAVGGYGLTHPHLLVGLMADHTTGIGERRQINLADGSVVELGSASSLSVSLTAQQRLLTVHDGEVFFTVAADATRPFIVEAANGRTEALGTAFNVKRLRHAVIVSVAEHAVKVAANGRTPLRVEQGQQLRYGPNGIEAADTVDLASVEAWRRDRLIFHHSPLGDVVADLERYRRGRIVVTDDRINALPVTAVIDARQTDAALRTIADTLPVTVRRITDLLVFISPAS